MSFTFFAFGHSLKRVPYCNMVKGVRNSNASYFPCSYQMTSGVTLQMPSLSHRMAWAIVVAAVHCGWVATFYVWIRCIWMFQWILISLSLSFSLPEKYDKMLGTYILKLFWQVLWQDYNKLGWYRSNHQTIQISGQEDFTSCTRI